MDLVIQESLQSSLIFKDISAQYRAHLTNGMRRRKLKAGKHLFHEGEEADYFYQLTSGVINLYRLSPEGDEKVFQQVRNGDTIAESAMFMKPNVYPVSARAEQDCELLIFSRLALLDLCKDNPDYAMQLLSAMSTRLHQTVNRIDQLTLKNAGQRLVAYLLEQHQLQHSEWLTLPVSHSILAGQLNIAPETLSRLFQRLRQAEAISGKRQTVVLLDIKKMCDLVNLPLITSGNLMMDQSGVQNTSMAGCCNLAPKWL
ncbi:Crp/Fnr family transcriptional regulator [Litoribacillus peritrichatus]